MKSSTLIMIMGGLLALSLGICGVWWYWGSTTIDASSQAAPAPLAHNDNWDGGRLELDTLGQDVTLLKAEVTALKHRLSEADYQADIALVQDKLHQLNDTVVQLSSAIHRRHNALPLANAERSDVEEPRAPETEALDETRLEARQHERINLVETSFQSEHVDQKWSGTAVAAIEQAFTSDRLATLPTVTECHSTLCRIELEHDDPLQMEEFLRFFPGMVADVMPRITAEQVENSDGSISMVVYLARAGHSLPQLD